MRLSARWNQAYAWMLLTVLANGATIPIIKWGLGDTSPFRFLMYRFTIASVIAVPILWHYRLEIQRYPKKVMQAIGIELLGTTAGLGILYLGLNLTSSLEANLILTTGPIFATLGGLWYFHDKIGKQQWLGLGMATSMTLVLTWLPYFALGALAASAGGSLVGNLLILLHNAVAVTYALLAKKVYHQLPKLLITCISALVGLVSFTALSFGEMSFNITSLVATVTTELHNPTVWAIALFAAIVTTYVGLTAFFKGQDLITVSQASLFGYLQPAVYLPLSFLLLGESLRPLQLGCFALVLVGVVLAEWKPAGLAKNRKRF